MKIERGARLGRYEVGGIIAAGGMGEVYRAHDTRLGREVAIKVLPDRFSSDPALRERFEREAQAVSNISHPNICTIFDVGRENDTDYLVMEYLQGETLAARIERGPMPLEDVIATGSEIAAAIDAAHRRGIVHRDLKPGNVMLTGSGAKVLDFGLAATSGVPDTETAVKPLTRTGQVLGTLQYMSPEQLRGAPVDARTDIYSLGIILHEMATGRHAFKGAERKPPPHVEPEALDAIIRHALADDPANRFQSARDVALALEDIGRRKSPRKSMVIAAAIAIVVVIAAIATFVALRRPAPADKRPSTIAVLPFANLGVDRSHDYLRLAIPDEITTILTYDAELSVRPFSSSRLLQPDTAPQLASKRLNAAAIVSGHVIDESGRLNVTLEAIDATADRLLWRDTLEVPSGDLVAMRQQLGSHIESGLMPKLAGAPPAHRASAPGNGEAYDLFLRAAAMQNEGQPNLDALALLRRAVAIDPNYANAWATIALREYYDVAYGHGGPAARTRSIEAAERAVQLDPDLVEAATRKIVNDTESGATIEAARAARALVARRPRSAHAHFTLSYPLRYGGMLEQSARECETANALDPGNRLFRSCATTFADLGDIAKEQQFERLDPDSGLVNRLKRAHFLRQHRLDEAIALSDPTLPLSALLVAVREHAPAKTLETLTEAVVTRAREVEDGESYYGLAGTLASVGRTDAAIELLREAQAKNFCVAPAIDNDPLYDSLRTLPAYADIHAAGVRCHDTFVAAMRQ